MSAFGDIKDGYPGLAKVMGPNSDQGFGIYKCFAELNARNLLMMQAELLGLEEELKTLTFLDESCPDPTRKAFARNVWRMRNTKNSEQWAKVLEIREKLQAYNQCLLQQAQLARLGKVNMYDLRLLIHWLEHQDGGNQFLQKFEQSVWDEQNIRDLVSISGRDPRDGFLRWFHQKLLPNLHHRIIELWREPMPGAEGTDLSRTNGNLLTSLSHFVNVALSSLIPVMAVLVLYTIERLPNRLYAVAGFSVVFSLTLAIFTTARPIEIFTATAAFASVQVVFVGGTNDSETTGQCPCVQ